MERHEKTLLTILSFLKDRRDTQAVVVQGFIARNGPLSEEAGAKVRELLGAKPNEQENR